MQTSPPTTQPEGILVVNLKGGINITSVHWCNTTQGSPLQLRDWNFTFRLIEACFFNFAKNLFSCFWSDVWFCFQASLVLFTTAYVTLDELTVRYCYNSVVVGCQFWRSVALDRLCLCLPPQAPYSTLIDSRCSGQTWSGARLFCCVRYLLAKCLYGYSFNLFASWDFTFWQHVSTCCHLTFNHLAYQCR
jgi:hypothetical protein